MEQAHFFGRAQWVGEKDAAPEDFAVLRGRFTVTSGARVTLYALGLGFFRAYVNGRAVNPDTFLPLSSEYEKSAEPTEESLTAQRIYVPSFDITPFVREGENVIALAYGGGWYTSRVRPFGAPKAIYRVAVEGPDGACDFVSDGQCRIGRSFVSEYNFTQYEMHDYTAWTDCLAPDYDDSAWPFCSCLPPLVTDYCETDCPRDHVAAVIAPVPAGETERGRIYDCGENTVGYPVLTVTAARGETVLVRFSEEMREGHLDDAHAHAQQFSVVSDGTGRTVQPEFTWFGFRYFEVIGQAGVACVKVVHADVPETAAFMCDNETLNWTYRTFVHTMLCNMHTGVPSDCPHIERRGYTGDGQLTCDAVFHIFDARRYYEKWLRDIADGQDTISGHIQYTAPYIRSGGGPGGWGSAIVEVPYRLYRYYGDKTVLETYYGAMRRYIDYLNTHTECGLVTSDKAGEWCLGDWCGPNILYPDRDITFHNQQVFLPAAMVNTYFAVKALEKMIDIARIIGRAADIPGYEKEMALRKTAIRAAYFNTFDGNYIMNIQGANAYAADIGLAGENTYRNLVNFYRKVGCYDTGIFGTEILTRVLFEHGDGDLALDLLLSDGPQGFEHWRRGGATTFHEYWDSARSRSHNHPMFGAVVACFFRYLLGIRQEEGSAGYDAVCIAPQCVHRFGHMSGHIETPHGTLAVAYAHENGETVFRMTIPAGVRARFSCAGVECALTAGENELTIRA